MSLVFVVGTRPEFVKVGPIVAELKALGITPTVIATGQHWDLLKGTPAETDLADSVSLGLPAHGDPLRWVGGAVSRIASKAQALQATMVVVQGDTASALAGARAGHKSGLPVVHIEAGVRSGNLDEPWPEEGFRREITMIADWHYAANQHCVDNLLKEGIPRERILLTGNPVVSALQRYANATVKPPQPHILLTMHRREWLASVDAGAFSAALDQFCERNPTLSLFWPMHPAVVQRGGFRFPDRPNFCAMGPLPYQRMVDFLSTAHGLATDSGGLVEEATTLGIPTAILRNSNDRPEAVTYGPARQFSRTDLETAFHWLTQDHGPRHPSGVYGDPRAAEWIAAHLRTLLGETESLQNTEKTLYPRYGKRS